MDKAQLKHIMDASHVADIDTADISKVFAENVSQIRTARGFTQDDMAYMLGVCKQTYFRIEAGTNAGVSSDIALKAANLFKVPVMSLFGFTNTSVEAYKDYMRCSDRTKRLIKSIMAADIKMQEMFSEFDPADLITVISFADELHDGMNANRFLHHEENISQYSKFDWYQDAHCILEINSNAYHPLYHYGDRLVICSRTPQNGEIGIFIKSTRFYMRKVENSPDFTHLRQLTYYDNLPVADMIVDRRNPDDMNQYTKFGTVIAVI